MVFDDYYWHYDYARLAWDTGFCFDKYKYPNMDRNKICLMDIDRIIKERDVASVERNLSIVVQFVLDNDQAEVLDSNFVKLFRLSQLSVEYLLFCKKYLDKTVVLLKKEIIKMKQQLKELKHYTEELESHISSSRNLTARFTCEMCLKIFTTEDYLNSHIKRRHDTNDKDISVPMNLEAEKLHSEIKELKERLNNTEKFIQEKPINKETIVKAPNEEKDEKTTKLASEIQDSFDRFRKQVEEKMTSLQSEKNFFTDKYDKLFEIVLQYKNTEQEHTNQEIHISEGRKNLETRKVENISTQTDEVRKLKTLQMHTIQDDNTFYFKEKDINQQEDIDGKIEKKLSDFEGNIENKISTGLCNIENQIQTFWQKLSMGDLTHSLPVTEAVQIVDQPVQIQVLNIEQDKPQITPRTKFTSRIPIKSTENEHVPALNDEVLENICGTKSAFRQGLQDIGVDSAVAYIRGKDSEDNTESCSKETVDIEQDQSADVIYSPTKKTGYQIQSDNLSIKSESRSSDENVNISPKKCSKVTVKDDLKNSNILNTEISHKMNNAINVALQEMGISPSWKGIPKKTFEKALEIVRHQANLNKKSLPQYDSLKKSIEKLLNNSSSKKLPNDGMGSLVNIRPIRTKTFKIQINKNDLPTSKSAPIIQIKNPSFYDSESETDINPYLPKKFNPEKTLDRKKAHSAVIEELHSKFSQKAGDTDSDLNSVILSIDGNDKKQTKSALKTFPSEGSLVRKKVFFEIEDSEDIEISEPRHEKVDSLSDFEVT